MKVEATLADEKSKFISHSELSPILKNINVLKKEVVVGFEENSEDEEDEFQ